MTDIVAEDSDAQEETAGGPAAPHPKEIKLADLKDKTPPALLAFAEEYEVENANTLRK